MSSARIISKNIFALGSAEIVSKFFQFILMVYAARILLKADFGKFSFALALSMIAFIVADFGLDTLLVREIARNKKQVTKYFWNAFFSKIFLSIFTLILIALFLNLFNYPLKTQIVVYIILIFTLISTFTELFYAVFRAFERMEFDAAIKITRMVILTAIGLFVLFKGYGVIAFSLAFVIAEIVVFFIALIITLKIFIKIELKINFNFIKQLLKKAYPFGLAIVFGSIYFYIASVILSKFKGDIEVATYSVAFNLVLALLFIPTVYTNAIYPVLSRFYKSSKEKLIFMYKKSFNYLYIIGIPISIGLFLLSSRIILFLYGKGYNNAAIVLKILSLFIFIKFINFLLGIILSSIDRQKYRMLGQGSTALFNIAINLILIPPFGIVGAAIATLITEIFLFIIYFYLVSKFLCLFNFIKYLIKPTIAAIIMAVFIIYVKVELLFLIPSAAIFYFILLLILRTFKEEDYSLLNRILKNE